MRSMLVAVVVVVVGAVLGCGGDGSAPKISDLTSAPATAPVGTTTTISGMFAFEDPDGDLLELQLAVRLPDGSRQEIPSSEISGVDGMERGILGYAVFLAPPAPGRYVLEISVRDASGHDSNVLEAFVDAS